MSFILDALKRSENERQENAETEFAAVPSRPDAPATPRWMWVLGALLAVNAVVIIGLMMWPETSSNSAQIAPITATPTPVAASDTESFSDQVADARRTQAAAIESEPEPAPAIQRVNSPTSLTSAAPVSVANLPVTRAALLPTLTELRANGTLQRLDLHVDIHVYSDVPSERFVFINMNKYEENSRLEEGPEIDEITRDGVILEYRGTTFRLPRE